LAPLTGAFAGIAEQQPQQLVIQRDDRIRYLFNAGYQDLQVDCHGIWQSKIQRCQVTPLVNFAVKDVLWQIPDGMLINGSKEQDREGREVYGKYMMYAGLEANRLLAMEGYQRWGLVELEPLRGWTIEQAGSLRIDEVYFPDRPQDAYLLSKWKPTNREIREQITTVQAEIKAGKHQLVNEIKAQLSAGVLPLGHQLVPELSQLYLKLGDLMLASLRVAERDQKKRLNLTHRGLKAKPGEEDYKRTYDDLDEECLIRTETAKQDAVLERLSDAALEQASRPINVTVERQDTTASDAVLTQLMEQNRMLQEELKAAREQSLANQQLIMEMFKSQQKPEPPTTSEPKKK
jgi:hypothetical protein